MGKLFNLEKINTSISFHKIKFKFLINNLLAIITYIGAYNMGMNCYELLIICNLFFLIFDREIAMVWIMKKL